MRVARTKVRCSLSSRDKAVRRQPVPDDGGGPLLLLCVRVCMVNSNNVVVLCFTMRHRLLVGRPGGLGSRMETPCRFLFVQFGSRFVVQCEETLI